VSVSTTASHKRDGYTRGAVALAIVLAAVTAVLGARTAPAHAGAREHMAQPARTLNGTDTADLHLVHAGERLLEQGAASGALPGMMRAELNLGATYTGSFTIFTRNGRITGNGTATPHGTGRYQSFAGSLIVTSGSGLYAHVHGRDALSGVFDRRTYSVSVKTAGSLDY
jgi:hypothetical protein